MAPTSDPLQYVLDHLKGSVNIQERLLCVSRLRVVALALGAEKTREQLLPFLQQLRNPPMCEEVGDEVLTSIAEVLGGFDEFVGGAEHAHLLLDPLIALCSIDETTVRSQAVIAINILGKKLSPEQIFRHLASKVKDLFCVTEWFTPRVSACGLVAVAYGGCKSCKKDEQAVAAADGKTFKPDELAKELVSEYRKACKETEPMVRRTAALKLAEAAEAFGDEVVKAELVEVFTDLIADTEQESIRVNALESAPAILRSSITSLKDPPGAAYIGFAEDKSWRVRVAVSASLPAVAKVSDDAQLCEIKFRELLKDNEAEVRNITAEQSAAAASVLGAQFAVDELVPIVKKLVMDEEQPNRVSLAGVLLEMAGPIGGQKAKKVYLMPDQDSGQSLLEQLVEQQNTNVRLAVISKLLAVIDVVEISEAQKALDLINTLITDKNWRIRHAALTLLPDLALLMKVDEFNKTFIQEAFKGLAEDNCALIRHDWILICKKIADVEGYGAEWLKSQVLPTVEKLHDHKNYQLKAVFLAGAEEFGELIGFEWLNRMFLPNALAMADEKERVANLRLMAAKALGATAQLGKGSTGADAKAWAESVKTSVEPALQKLSQDADMDVQSQANLALDAIGE